MRPVRMIHLGNLRYKYLSVTQEDTKMVVRILVPVTDTFATSGDKILTCEELRFKNINIENTIYQVAAEGIFDLENALHRSWWQPNANICFTVNRSFAKGNISIIPMHFFAAGKEKTPEWVQRNGYDVVAQLYCWSATDPITNSPASFAADNKGKIFTNIPNERFVHVDKVWMQRPDRSDFLVIKHHVSFEKHGKNALLFSVNCTDNQGNPIDVNGIYKVEATAGYLPINEFQMIHGKCSFPWIPLMLGEGKVSIRLKDSQNFVCKEITLELM